MFKVKRMYNIQRNKLNIPRILYIMMMVIAFILKQFGTERIIDKVNPKPAEKTQSLRTEDTLLNLL